MTVPELEPSMARAIRLEWWTIGWVASIIVVMGLAMGGSQAMKTAWAEDMLSLIPPAVFLIAARFERKGPTRRFPFGFRRVNSLSFLIAAVALTALGLVLLGDAAATLIAQDRPVVGSMVVFGHAIWAGWIMIAAQTYSVIPPLILGRMKLPYARRLQDKVLHTDAMTQKADWMTGLAGIGGVAGIGFGLWWADALAAAIIAFSIVRDGIAALRSATAELVDGAPRALDRCTVADDAVALQQALERHFPGGQVCLRETGRVIRAEIAGVAPPADLPPLRDLWPGKPDRAWRLASVAFVPPVRGHDPRD